MRNPLPEPLERTRQTTGAYASKPGERAGVFIVPTPWKTKIHCVLGTDDSGTWERVSAMAEQKRGDFRPPTWDEMQFVKRSFWADDELVVQFHPAGERFTGTVSSMLHLWHATEAAIPTPEADLLTIPRPSRIIRPFKS